MKAGKKRKRGKRFMVLFALAMLLLFLWWQTYDIVVTSYLWSSAKLAPALQGFQIVQISDLHNKNFGCRLAKVVAAQQPDMIVITGDFISRHSKSFDQSLALLKQVVKLAPVYYIAGNHEAGAESYPELKIALDAYGVIRLEDAAVLVEHEGAQLQLAGLTDPAFHSQGGKATPQAAQRVQDTLSTLLHPQLPTILLAHRPAFFEAYTKSGADLVLCGHAHGGQIRLPFIGALLAPDEGFFPRYTSGIHRQESTGMVVSRGLGDSRWMPLRLFNRPEVVVVTLQSKGQNAGESARKKTAVQSQQPLTARSGGIKALLQNFGFLPARA